MNFGCWRAAVRSFGRRRAAARSPNARYARKVQLLPKSCRRKSPRKHTCFGLPKACTVAVWLVVWFCIASPFVYRRLSSHGLPWLFCFSFVRFADIQVFFFFFFFVSAILVPTLIPVFAMLAILHSLLVIEFILFWLSLNFLVYLVWSNKFC